MPTADLDPTIHEVGGWRRLLLWPAAFILRLWGRSLRFELDATSEAAVRRCDRALAVVLWHNRLFVTPEIQRRFRATRPNHALVSASRDGAWLSAFLSLVGMRTIRGSSSRFGREAAAALIEALKAGHDVGITPDGPRGPCYDLKSGVITIARSARAPLLLIGAEYPRAWRTRSWDRFYLPKPFSTVRLHCRVREPDPAAAAAAVAGEVRDELLRLSPDGPGPDPRPVRKPA